MSKPDLKCLLEKLPSFVVARTLAYEVCRYRTAEGKKKFKIRTPHGWGPNRQKAILHKKIRGP